MATIVFSALAGKALAAAGAGIITTVIGVAAAGAIGSAIDNWLKGDSTIHMHQEGSRLANLKVQCSQYGKVIPCVYGTVRLAGNVIWSRPIEEHMVESTTRTGSIATHHKNYTYTVTLAICLCRGPIDGILRAWADSKQLDLSRISYTLYLGSETQLPDTTISSFEHKDEVPAYRGLAYIVIKDFPLADYGNHIPNFTFEVKRNFFGVSESATSSSLPSSSSTSSSPSEALRLEHKIKQITFGRGVGAYLYDTSVQESAFGGDASFKIKINQNNSSDKADALVALDDMKQVLSNVEYVCLPVYWFLDTKAIEFSIRPGINSMSMMLDNPSPDEWQVGRYQRYSALNISPSDFDTPSDLSILRIARELKNRGYKVMLCPKLLAYDRDKFLFIDDVTIIRKDSDITAFFSALDGYNDFIKHYMSLEVGEIKLRDYIDAFTFGSGKLVSQVASYRSETGKFPAIEYLKRLAQTLRAGFSDKNTDKSINNNIDKNVKKNVKIIYSAFSHLYHSSNRWYYLDDLWSDKNIDAVGIDCYFPLAQSSDKTGTLAITYDQVWSGWQSGEGWDSEHINLKDGNEEEREATISLIEAFAWKNIKYWWSNFHYNIDGKKTSWVPKMKPIWITDLAFGSVEGCINEPEVFSSPQFRLPRGSRGRIDFASQRVALSASLDYLSSLSKLKLEPKLDGGAKSGSEPESASPEPTFFEKSFVSYWDTRPYPFYPHLERAWGLEYSWSKDASLQGKLGLITLNSIVKDLLNEVGVSANMYDALALVDVVRGYVITGRQSIRASLEQLAAGYFFDMVELGGVLKFTRRGGQSQVTIDSTECVAQNIGGSSNNDLGNSFTLTRIQELDLPRSVDIIYMNSCANYEAGTVKSQRQNVNALNLVSLNLPLVLSPQEARRIAEITLLQAWITRLQYKLTLPPRYMHLNPTDVITINKKSNVESENGSGNEFEDDYELGSENEDKLEDENEFERDGGGMVGVQSHLMRIVSTKLMLNGAKEIVAVAEDISHYEYYNHGEQDTVYSLTSLLYPCATYRAKEQIEDFGSLQTSVVVQVFQLSALVGRGHPGIATV